MVDWLVNSRTELERDFDRVLFAAPTRRLGDKTQVFPLEKNESVRNRLTHSHEVSNLARSVGTYLVYGSLGNAIVDAAAPAFGSGAESIVRRGIPAILAAAGLAHDLGNPPFGHQGEEAIRDWIDRNDPEIFGVSERQKCKLGEEGRNRIVRDLECLTMSHREDFRKFEGNAQTLRTLTRLQVVTNDRGLNLTIGTLAALMKYTVSSDRVQAKAKAKGKVVPAPTRKVGYFASEAEIVNRIRGEAGLTGHVRHPLTLIMEACDDIAYAIVDSEDAVKKQIVSFHDLMAWLRSRDEIENDKVTKWILDKAEAGAAAAWKARLPPAEINDISMQIFRTNSINAMVSATIVAFESNYEKIMEGNFESSLLDESIAGKFAVAMKAFDFEHAYKHRRVLEIELNGFNTIHGLMDMLWRGIVEREDFDVLGSPRTSPFARYAYSRISENYRRVFEGRLHSASDDCASLPIRYRELQLLTDMISGMTDQFAVDLHQELRNFHVGASTSS